MSSTLLHQWLDDLLRYEQLSPAERSDLGPAASAVQIASVEEAESLLARLAEPTLAAEADPFLATVLETFCRDVRAEPGRWRFSQDALAAFRALYQKLPADARSRQQLLRVLAAQGSAAALAALAESLVSDPPRRPEEALVALAPLFERRAYAASALFPRLLDALEHPLLAAPIVDLCNYLTRQQMLPRHPAADRVDQLAGLLQSIVQRLERLEESPQEFAGSPEELTRLVGEGVGLVVALCDALALVGDARVTGKLRQALALAHRRVRTEAAAALARLGDPEGLVALADLAAQPLVRTRVLAYLAELGQLEAANDQYRSPVARAEGDLAAWLAEPMHFGVPPTRLELVDAQRLYWPGFHEPVDCYLFRYEFRLGEKSHSGIALAGPTTHALLADLEDLPPVDIYAAYAGWSAEHGEIREWPADQIPPELRVRWQEARVEIEQAGYGQPTLVMVGQFFEREHFVAHALRDGHAGVVIWTESQATWYPAPTSRRPLGPTEVYYIHKGREMLRAFNPEP